MSLDVYLHDGPDPEPHPCKACGGTGTIRPGREPVFESNVTHNLNRMAEAAGIYRHLWRPEEIGVTKAGQLVQPLREGLARLRSDPGHFKKYNPENGWGNYDGLVRFVSNYLDACEQFPDADVTACR